MIPQKDPNLIIRLTITLTGITRQLFHTPRGRSNSNAGALVHFLPPYSPDFNPIEDGNGTNIETILLSAFATVTPEDGEGWNSIYTQHDT